MSEEPNKNNKIGRDLKITEVTESLDGRITWVSGTLNGYLFTATMVDQESPSGINDGRITSLSLHRLKDNKTTCRFDRGDEQVRDWDDTLSDQIASFLAHDVLPNLDQILGTKLSQHAFSMPRSVANADRQTEPSRQDHDSLPKQHWEDSLRDFDKIEQAHGGQASRPQHDEVEELRARVEKRTAKAAKKRASKPEQELGYEM